MPTPELGLNPIVDNGKKLLEFTGVTTGFPDGTEVNVLIMDIMGNSTSVIATIQNGSFGVANIDASKFTPGELTFTATANDTLSTAKATLADIPSGDPIVIDQSGLNGLNKLTIVGKAPSLKVNDQLTLLVRDTSGTSVTTTAVVQSDGSFSVSNLSTQGLKDGLLIIDVMALTNSGAISVVNAANVTLSNLTPLGTDKTLQATEDVGLVIAAADFGYSNTDGFSMTGVKIAGLPVQGTLKLNGVAVVADQFISLADLSANKLVFQGAANANGTNYANFQFKVLDNRPVNNEDLVANTITFNVAAVNDVPVVTAAGAIATVNEDSASATAANLWATAPTFGKGGGSDETTQTLTYKITAIPAFITLFKGDGTTAVTAGTTVTADEFAALKYKTVANANGTGSVTFDVIDSGSGTAPNVNTLSSQSVSMTVTAVNDVPVVTTAGAITTVNEDSANATATSLWSTAPAFSQGPSDENTQTLTYKITAIPAFITLFKGDGTTAVTAGTTVTADEFAALKYKTVANANGTGSVTFDVIDSGSGTAPNVNTLSSQSVSMTVTAVNDVPVVTTAGAITTVNEDSANATATSLWSTAPAFSQGPSDENTQTLTYKITAIPAFITLFKGDGTTAVTAGTTVTADEFAALKYKTVANANGTGSVTFDVIDSGSGTAPNVNTLSSQSVSMTVTAVNDVPVVTTAGAITTVNEDSANATATSLWSTAPSFSQGPSDETTQTLTYKITAIPAFITLFKGDGTTAVTAGTTVTADEFAALKYKTVANANGTGSVTFDVIDSGSGTAPNVNTLSSQSVSMTVTAVNDVPVVTTAGAITTVNEDSANATATSLWSTAPSFSQGPTDENTQTLTYKITAIPAFITLFKGDGTTAVTAGTTVSSIEFAALKYKTVADANGTGSVTFDVIDSGSGTAPNVNTLSNQSVSMTVTAVNDAPVLGDTALSFTALAEDAAAPSGAVGSLVSALVGGISDVDSGAVKGIAITGTNTTNGTLYYSTNGGSTWTAVGAVSNTSALLLASDANTRLYYQPAANYSGTTADAVSLVAWDQTSGIAGTKVTTATNGGTSAFSTASDTISLNVTSVNDAPTASNKTITVDEDGSKTFAAADFGFADAADSPANALKAVTITSLPAAGTLKLNGVLVTANQSIAVADLGNLVYAPAANANGSAYASFGFKVQDDGGITNGGVDTSTTANTITINVNAVNDAPVLADTSVTMSAVLQGSGVVPTGAAGVLVSSLVGGVSDIDAGAVKGIAITGVNTAKGTLYYSLDGGTNWSALTDASDSNARLLKADADNRVYFKAAADTTGTVADALTFRAWDATTGTEGLTGNVTPSGGTTAYSQTPDTVSEYVVQPVTINAVSTDDLLNVSEPLLITGKADPNAVVTLNINSQNINVTANATGDWSYDGSKVRYIMVRKTLQNLAETDPNYAANGVMTIGDVTVMSGGTNVALNATQTTSNLAPFRYMVGFDQIMHDGSVAENSFIEAYGFDVPGGAGGDVWVQLDLGNWYAVDSIDVRARNNFGTRANGTKVYVSTTDMSALTTAQLDAAVSVGAPSTVTGMTNTGSTTYQVANPVATYADALLAGPNTITASESVQGVSSQAIRVVTLDNLAPVTVVTSAALSADTGTSNTDFITSVAAQTITGNLSANLATGEKVMVSLDNGVTWTAATATVGTSTWSLPGVTLSGTNTLQAKVVDTAGNGSTPYSKVYALVTVSDLTVGITQIDDNAGTATVVLSGGTSNDTTPQLTGNLGGATQGAALAANEVVNVYRTPNLAAATVLQAGSLTDTQILSGNPLTHYFIGDFNYGPTGNVYLPTTPANGDMVVFTKTSNWGLSVYAGTTLVGNVGTANVGSGGQDNLYFKWDSTKGQWLTGTNALIKVGTAVVTTNAAGQSTWTLTDNTGLGNSDSVNYIAQVENTAGTFGRQSTPGALDWRYNVDNVAPSSINLIGTDDVAPVTGTITANTVTNDDKPTFSGTTEANAVVKVYDGATLLGTTTANGSGAWSFTPTTALATGAHSVTATATDAYGNTTAPTTALPFTIDTTAPVAVADTNSGTEDVASLTGTVATNDTSKDGSETFALVGSGTGVKGTVVINANGSYTYTRTSSADEITVDLVETFTYKVTDAAGNTTQSTLKITLTPVNDAATFNGDIVKTITETNAAETVSGTLTVSDVDSPTTVVAQNAVAGSAGYGKFTISSAGVWSYVMNSAQDQFVAGQTYDDTLTVTTADGTQQVIKVTITGTNDAPTVVSSTSSLGKVFFTENGAPVLARGGTITLSDAEQVNLQSATVRVVDMNTGTPVTGDTLTFTIPAGSGITSSFDAATGTMTFAGSATQAQYQSLFDSVKFSNARDDLVGGGRNVYYAVKDASGVISNQALTRVDVLRLNDAPVLDNTVNLSLASVVPTVSDTAPTGTVGVLVSSLVGGVSDGDLTLADGVTAVSKGIAIVGANSALGKVYFSQNNGTSWFTPSFDLSDTTALLLKADANTRVFFRPNAGVEGQIANALTIRAWDTTDNKSSLNLSNVIQHNISGTLGGTNAYSVAIDTVSLSVATVATAGFNGTSGNDTLTGTAANEVILGNGGVDVINAGAGNDKVVINDSNVAALSAANAANISGGTGVNILKLIGAELTLDLTNATVSGKVDNFSTVDITSNVNNLLKLNLNTVQTLSGATDNATTTGVDESKMMVVLADAGDAVVLQDAANWTVLNGLKGSDLATTYGADYGFSTTRQYSQYSKDGATLFVDQLAPVGDIVGTSGNDTLTGTANADVIYGNGGVDAIAAGAGKDTVILGASSLTALAASTNTATVNGGTDINTLKLSGINLNLDLTNVTVMGKLDNFNVIDMKQGSGNVFKLGLTEVLALAGGTDNAATVGVDESKMLVLQGNGGVAYNTLQLVNGVNWTSVTNLGGTSLQTTYGAEFGFEAGRSYTQYTSGAANLFVDQSLLQTMV